MSKIDSSYEIEDYLVGGGGQPDVTLNSGKVTFQRHHLIPTAIAGQSDLIKKLASRKLYKHIDFDHNGMWLPSELSDALALGIGAKEPAASSVNTSVWVFG
jgi:hypothetical protein